MTALKKAEEGNALVARFYEWAGEGGEITLSVPPGAKSAAIVNLMEQPTGKTLPVSNGKISVPVTPYEIQTVRIDY
jgi:alpha-mannosidase